MAELISISVAIKVVATEQTILLVLLTHSPGLKNVLPITISQKITFILKTVHFLNHKEIIARLLIE